MLIQKGNAILFGKRHDDPQKALSALHGEGTWTVPGGKLEFGESFEDGAVREVFEETGLRIRRVRVVCVNNDKVEDAHVVTSGMVCDSFECKPCV